MRKIITVLIALSLPMLTFAQDRVVTLNLNKQFISSLFKQIEEQSKYSFVYSDDVVSDTMRISLNVTNMSVNEVLTKILPEQNLYHQMITNRLIAIGSRKQLAKEKSIYKTTLNGKIVDLKGKGVPFASVGLFDDNVLLGGSISNETGNFQLAFNFLPNYTYRLKITSVGFKSKEMDFTYPDTLAAKQITLGDDQLALKTVNVTGTKPLMERKTDRYIVNVEGSFLANGMNGLEVLQRSPGIWVDNNGGIKIRGNQSVMVMINDVVQRMSGNDLADYLRTLKSEDISKIEIISSPPSEFEASGSGGIIHIILKKSRKDGLVGSVNTQYRQIENRYGYGVGLTLNYKVKNLYLFGSVSAGNEKSESIATNRVTYPNQDSYSSNTDRYNNNDATKYQFSAGYDLGKNQSIGIQTVQTGTKLNQYFNTYNNFIGAQPLSGTARSDWYRKPSLSGTTINYVWKLDSLGSSFKVIGDYIYSNRKEVNNFSSVYDVPSKNSTYRNNTPNTTNVYSLQTDYTKVLKQQISIKAGLKFASTTRDNEVINENYTGGTWVLNPNLSNQFIYKEDLSMAYASMEKSWKKLSVKAGLRAEHTHMNGNSITLNNQFTRNYLGLFPSVFINQKLDEEKGSAIYFSYGRRLQRPSFADLNPYRLQFDDYLVQIGNPDLTPEYTHKFEVGSYFWKDIAADLYFAVTTDRVAQLAQPVAGNVIEYQNRNFSSSKEYGFSIYAPVKFFKWWTMNTSLSGFNLRYNLGNYQISQSTLNVSLQHAVTIKNIVDLDVYGYYRSPSVNANTKSSEQFNVDAGLTKRLLNKKLQIRTYFADIFNLAREKSYTEYLGTSIDFYQKRQTRTINLSLNYTFSSGKKFSNKKIEQSNDDEKRRIGN
ncbi:TonB-dependent receptor domain-containing protein [Pedobacter boryungensis]|uniref:TonB-dependent receptor n=1 Tax=Pedobacter boryungensis TaxID=869962 RepID=A0ABX2DD27_9SPHI|nr:TonB-dependent receptor [Pedobacter boryungensis]NQX31054.1 TonB-dependent receptor [Pedobacter boryungensis]